jgi:phosphonate metabolism protein (transferase hexapeptide repeat family)
MLESSMDDYSYIVNDVQVAYTTIGKFCSIAAQCRINPGNHPMWRAALHHFSYRSVAYGLAEEDDASFFDWRRDHEVVIEHDVWVGHGATIMPGVKLGTGCVVGAGAVVTKDVPAFSVAVGVPSKVIRSRFDEVTQARLHQISWWDWSHEKIREHLMDFRNLTAEEFAEKFAPQ